MTIRVHYYEDRDGLSVCKNCGMIENKDRFGPSWCSGRLPSVGLRVPEAGLSVEHGAVLSVTDESVLALRAELADVLAERDAMQSIATQASRELSRVTAERDSLKAQLELAEAFHNVAVKERDEARVLRTVEADKAKRDALLLQQRVSDLKFALGSDSVGWFDRCKAAERERDEALAEARRVCDRLLAYERVVEAARSFRRADTSGSFNDRVACGKALDAALAALDGKEP